LIAKTLEQRIRQRLDEIIGMNLELSVFLDQLSQHGRVVVFGGFVRDCIHNYIHNQEIRSKDLDLVVDGTIVPSDGDSRNNFDGRRRSLRGGLKIDFWELRRTYAFLKGLFAPSLDNLPLTTVYTVNGCFFDLTDDRLVEKDAVSDVTKKVIAFNCTDYLATFPEYQAFRGIELAHRLGYELHQDVLDFVLSQLRGSPADLFVRAVQAHRPKLSKAAIEKLCGRYANAGNDPQQANG
jgi:hypothetical protein